jgi:hypothetical protein
MKNKHPQFPRRTVARPLFINNEWKKGFVECFDAAERDYVALRKFIKKYFRRK